tara:strand:+ start:7363 stop:7548 length:186 start_codon:yes stop_codon:yes gene_type:complete
MSRYIIGSIGAFTVLLSSSLFYLGASNNRLADTNDALSADLQLLIEVIEYSAPQQKPQIYW